MYEYFVVANSFAAPFFSDTSTEYVRGESPQSALEDYANSYSHPCGLYSAHLYRSADAYHKREQPLGKWLCNRAIEEAEKTQGLGCYVFSSDGPGCFTIDGQRHVVNNPKGGRVVPA